MADIAIDLGTASTLIHVRGEGIVINEPSVVAVDRRDGKVIAVGYEAKRMLGRTHREISALRPMRGGVIADVDRVDMMLRHFLNLVLPKRRFLSRPRVVLTVPSGITEMERRAVRAGVIAAGARSVYMMSEPLAAAIGAGRPVNTPRGTMVVNVGGGTTEIGMVALSGLVAQTSLRVGGIDLDEAIAAYVRRAHNLLIGESSAEEVKMRIGTACDLGEEWTTEVKGRDLVSGIPRTLILGSTEVRECMREQVQAIVATTRRALELTPPELASDVVDEGLVLTGGGALLTGLDQLIARETQLPVHLVDDPITTVVSGAGRALEEWDTYRDVLAA